MKYIDAEKLKIEIQNLINLGYDKLQGNLYHVISIIASLQQEQPEVDLEKEVESYLDDFIKNPTRTYFRDAIHHFYELGLNARKEE